VSEFALGMKRRCAQCGETFEVTEENTVALEMPQRGSYKPFAAKSTDDLKGVEGPQRCARCGKPFRGDWDRYSSPAGLVCHICANLAGAEPDRPTPVVPPPVRTPTLKAQEERPEPQIGEGTLLDQFGEFRQTQTFRIGLYVAAFSVIVVAIFYSFFYTFPEPGASTGDQRTTEEQTKVGLALWGPPEELTKNQHIAVAVLVVAVSFVLRLVPCFLALLVTHLWSGGLPGSTWWAGTLHMALMSLFPVFIPAFLSFVPIIGWLVGWLVALYILHEAYNFSLADLFKFVMLTMVFSLLIAPLRALVFGVLGALLF